MAILGRDGQLIANASQRTIVFDTIEEYEAFKDNLPEGVNVTEAFDVYVKESGEVYAAGTPFKLRETTDNIVELHVSPTGTGEGTSAEDALSANELGNKLAMLAAHFDFNNQNFTIYFAAGEYGNLMFFQEFLNCTMITLMPEIGVSDFAVTADNKLDSTQMVVFSNFNNAYYSAGYNIRHMINTPLSIENVGFRFTDGAVIAAKGQVNMVDCSFEAAGTQPMNPGQYGVIHANGGHILILTTRGIVNLESIKDDIPVNVDNRYDAGKKWLPDAMMLADYGGKITFSARPDLFMNDGKYDGFYSVFMASDLGSVQLYGIAQQGEFQLDAGADRYEQMTQAGWAVAKRNGVMYIPKDGLITVASMANCDNTSTLIKEGEI